MDNERWYCLQVLTAQESEVAALLCRRGIRAIAPACKKWERSGGDWKLVARQAIPGYVFIRATMTAELYYHISAKPGVIQILGMGTDNWTAIPEDQIGWIAALSAAYAGTDGDSTGVKRADGAIEITDGPLTQMRDKIVGIDARRRLATVEIKIHDKTYQISAGITITNEPQESLER